MTDSAKWPDRSIIQGPDFVGVRIGSRRNTVRCAAGAITVAEARPALRAWAGRRVDITGFPVVRWPSEAA